MVELDNGAEVDGFDPVEFNASINVDGRFVIIVDGSCTAFE
jgi:hypothetical protein